MRAPALLALPLALAACSPKPSAPAAQAFVALDCAKPYETLKTEVLAQPGLDAKPKEPTEPYRAYSVAEGRVSYLLTDPDAPAHPAILMQEAVGGGEVRDSGCAYGDTAAYEELRAYLASMRAAR